MGTFFVLLFKCLCSLFDQVVFDESLQKCLDSYLHHAPRSLDMTTLPSSSAADMQRSVHKAVFLTFLRMATHKESKVGSYIERIWAVPMATYWLVNNDNLPQDNFITPAVFGEIIYDNFLFDIPKILDLCVLFGKGNGQLLHKMIGKLFFCESDYTVPVPCTHKVQNIKNKCFFVTNWLQFRVNCLFKAMAHISNNNVRSRVPVPKVTSLFLVLNFTHRVFQKTFLHSSRHTTVIWKRQFPLCYR